MTIFRQTIFRQSSGGRYVGEAHHRPHPIKQNYPVTGSPGIAKTVELLFVVAASKQDGHMYAGPSRKTNINGEGRHVSHAAKKNK
jgi:hypothetical protein